MKFEFLPQLYKVHRHPSIYPVEVNTKIPPSSGRWPKSGTSGEARVRAFCQSSLLPLKQEVAISCVVKHKVPKEPLSVADIKDPMDEFRHPLVR